MSVFRFLAYYFLPHPQTSQVLSIPSDRTLVRGTTSSPPGWDIMVKSPAFSSPLPLNSSPAIGDLSSSFKGTLVPLSHFHPSTGSGFQAKPVAPGDKPGMRA